jgi:hypothetical protein
LQRRDKKSVGALPDGVSVPRDALLVDCGLRLRETIPAMAALIERGLMISWLEVGRLAPDG